GGAARRRFPDPAFLSVPARPADFCPSPAQPAGTLAHLGRRVAAEPRLAERVDRGRSAAHAPATGLAGRCAGRGRARALCGQCTPCRGRGHTATRPGRAGPPALPHHAGGGMARPLRISRLPAPAQGVQGGRARLAA
ncbi:hypothetical protein OIO03_24770, partial [Acinetobacter baumannii]|nr:hypothetical protein [Acinetobacter baumannii]MCW1766813.1 hypothetical protein [Acinetobacter baumannii]